MSTFGTYDFETSKWTEPVCVDVYDEHAGHAYFASDDPMEVVKFALHEMNACEAIGIFWAHNGGKFDALFILEALMTLPGWSAVAHIAAGRIVCLKIYSPQRMFELRDSYAVVQAGLDKALTSFGIPHAKVFTKEDYKRIDANPDYMRQLMKHEPAKLKRGCQADTEALFLLVKRAESLFEEWGGSLKATFSSSALSVVKAKLGVPLPSHEGRQWANDIARRAYAGGRVEVFRHRVLHALSEYDVTSSYPWSMSQLLPWELVGYGEPHLFPEEGDRLMSVVYAKVTVPPQHIPPLPYVPPTGGLFFPTGTWSGWFNGNELAYAIEHCGVTAKFMDAVNYTAARPFSQFINEVFALKARSSGALREFCKLVLNGCYGKFAQKPEREALHIFATREEGVAFGRGTRFKDPTPINDALTVWTVKENRWPKHTHYAMAGFITAYSRILLHKHMTSVQGLAYCDTDSVHCLDNPTLRAASEKYGKDLGALAHKRDMTGALYCAPKLYRLDLDNGEQHFASKGFPVEKAAFERIIEGDRVGNQKGRMQLAKTQLKKADGVRHLTEDETAKAWSGHSVKRRAHADIEGSTSAWTVEELHNGDHQAQRSPVASHRVV